MKFKTSIAAALAVGALIAGSAYAGAKFIGNGSVVVTKNADGSGSASGYLGHIYNAPTVNEFIGCQKYVTGGLYCQAKSEANVHVTCNSSSAYLGNAVSSLSPDARLNFRWNASGQCVSITVVHSSEYQDKQG
jgi:uncharacterized protein (DUF1919 family)